MCIPSTWKAFTQHIHHVSPISTSTHSHSSPLAPQHFQHNVAVNRNLQPVWSGWYSSITIIIVVDDDDVNVHRYTHQSWWMDIIVVTDFVWLSKNSWVLPIIPCLRATSDTWNIKSIFRVVYYYYCCCCCCCIRLGNIVRFTPKRFFCCFVSHENQLIEHIVCHISISRFFSVFSCIFLWLLRVGNAIFLFFCNVKL